MTSSRTQRRWRRKLLWIVGLTAVLGGLTLLILEGAPDLEVEVAPVTRGTWVAVIEEDGRARVRDRFVISAPVAGTLARPSLRVGDAVVRGDVVARLQPALAPMLDARSRAELEERVGAAEAQVAAARSAEARADAARSQAARDLARARKLAPTNVISPREREAELAATLATREHEVARQTKHATEHTLAQARAALSSAGAAPGGIDLVAPGDGQVLRILVESEAVVAPGTPLLEIGDPKTLEVVVDLLSTDAVRVRPGSEAELSGFGGGTPLKARVRTVEPVAHIRLSALGVEEKRVDVIVEPIETTEVWARVGDGYRVDVALVVERLEGAMRVPTSALFRARGAWMALVVRDGRAHRTPVTVSRYGPVGSVTSNLAEGDLVVVRPPEDLKDGEAVTLRQP